MATKGIQQYRVSCVGISPMLQNPMTDETLDELFYGSGGKRKLPKTDVPLEKIAEARLCRGPNGEFGFPANYLFAALIEAGRQVIFDKKTKVSTRESSLVPAFLTIVPNLLDEKGDGFIPFTGQDAKWVVDKRRGVNPATGGAMAVVRPKFPNWDFEATVEIDLDQIAVEKVLELFNIAGRSSGIGDFRPSKRGPFGKFRVTKWEVVEQGLKVAA